MKQLTILCSSDLADKVRNVKNPASPLLNIKSGLKNLVHRHYVRPAQRKNTVAATLGVGHNEREEAPHIFNEHRSNPLLTAPKDGHKGKIFRISQ